MADHTIKIVCESIGADETLEKVKQLKSLLEEVKESVASLDLNITVNGKPISENHQIND